MNKIETALNGNKPVIALFTASHNAACQQMNPVLHEVEHQAGDRVNVLTVNTDTGNEMMGLYHIQTVPTVALIKEGRVIWKKSGLVPAHEILEHLSLHIA